MTSSPPQSGSTPNRIIVFGIIGLGLVLASPLALHLINAGTGPILFHAPTLVSKAIFVSILLPTAMVAAMTFAAGTICYEKSRPWMLAVLGPVFLALALLNLAHLVALELDPGNLEMGRLILSTILIRLLVASGFVAVVAARPDRHVTRILGRRILVALSLVAMVGTVGLWVEPWGWSGIFGSGSRFTAIKQGSHLLIGLCFLACALGFLWRLSRQVLPWTPWLAAAALAWAVGEFSHVLNTVPFGGLALLGHAYFLLATLFAHVAVFKAAFRLPLTALNQARIESQAREERLQLAFEGAEEGYWDWDLVSDKVYRSPGALSILGYGPDEAEPTLAFMMRLVDPEAVPGIQAARREHLEGRSPSYRTEYRCQTSTGRWIWVLDQGRVVQRDDENRPLRMAGTLKEITLQKQMEFALRASEAEAQKLALVASHTDNLVTISDAQGRIEWVNEAFTRITGYGQEEVQGRKLVGFLQGAHSDPSSIRFMRGQLEAGEGFSSEIVNQGKSGQLIWVSLSLQPIRDEAGAVSRWISVGRDITDMKRGEEALCQTQKLESLGVLASGIAHDFNNLLSAIRGNVDLAQLKQEAGQAFEIHCQNIRAIVNRASDLTRQLMSYAGKRDFDSKPVDLNALVTEMAALLSVSLTKRVQISYHLGEGLPAVLGDPAQLQQVIMNLVINGSDAIGDHPGTIQIRTDLLDLDEEAITRTFPGQPLMPGPHVLLEVADSGCGMSHETLSRIFDPFYTTKVHGRGLGLSAMLGILRSHHAGIQVESIVGAGTTFRIYLAATQTAEKDEPPAPSQVARHSGRALVVEDDEATRKTSVELMKTLGFDVVEAKDGLEGTERFRHEGPFAVVLMDMLMPGLDGLSACEVMTAHSKQVHIILCSGTMTPQTVREICASCGECQSRAYLAKPFGLRELNRAIEEASGGAESSLPCGEEPPPSG